MRRRPATRWTSALALGLLAASCGRTDISQVSQTAPGVPAGTDPTGDDADTTHTQDATTRGLTTPDASTSGPPITTTEPRTTEPRTTEPTTGIGLDLGTPSVCGDGVQDPGEECDPGESLIGPGEFCLDGCIDNVCGDGDQSPDEQCDDGNDDDTDACRNDCVFASCGDGIRQAGEACDDGNDSNGDACLTDCTNATCGDGFVFAGAEDCDDGEGNQPSAECTPACLFNVCGDGFQRFDEPCDPGEDNIGPGLECRDGCVLNVCGDGDTWIDQEACDDGNTVSTDACIECVEAECGDGIVFEGHEACDDGNFSNRDECGTSCLRPTARRVSVGGSHTCLVFSNSRFKCWGNGANGRTGQGNEDDLGDDEPAGSAAFVDAGFNSARVIAAGLSHTCVGSPVSLDGEFYKCFGDGSEGQLGYGNTEDLGDDEPVSAIPFLNLPFGHNVASGGSSNHSCSILFEPSLRCWGSQSFSQLGLPGFSENLGDDEQITAVAPIDMGLSGGFDDAPRKIASGARHTCVSLDDGNVRCWGDGSEGALGYGDTEDIGDDENLLENVPIGAEVVDIAAGSFHTCVITTEQDVMCWGRGTDGQLGYGNTDSVGDSLRPVDVGPVFIGGGTPVELAAGDRHTCVRMSDGAVRCWGASDQGQLGYGNTESIGDTESPFVAGNVSIGARARDIAAGGTHTCVVLDVTVTNPSTGLPNAVDPLRCWGAGANGRLGYGNEENIGDDETPASVGDVPLFQ